MPLWKPSEIWKGQDAILIGGGSSIKGFDFSLLAGHNTLGCNDAVFIEPELTAVVFGDIKWWHNRIWKLQAFKGLKFGVTDTPILNVPWLSAIKRVQHGLPTDGTIGFNYSTGACAIHLALVLGARRIFLLGYDLTAGERGRTHWHNNYPRRTTPIAFRRFQNGYRTVAEVLPKVYPDAQVINITDGMSKLGHFPRMGLRGFCNYLAAPSLPLGEVQHFAADVHALNEDKTAGKQQEEVAA